MVGSILPVDDHAARLLPKHLAGHADQGAMEFPADGKIVGCLAKVVQY
jgi:hypothetical protein